MTTRPRDAARLHTFTLVRVSPDAEERVSTHPTFEEGWAAGQSAVHADEQAAFSLYAPSGECKARYNHAALSPRLLVSKLDALVTS
ncbi:MAG: hypothetical protein H0U55_14560 [Rubrobacteraceae bacterium]|nr:hypothetical protein [Rubrobacteraceae bacterium]